MVSLLETGILRKNAMKYDTIAFEGSLSTPNLKRSHSILFWCKSKFFQLIKWKLVNRLRKVDFRLIQHIVWDTFHMIAFTFVKSRYLQYKEANTQKKFRFISCILFPYLLHLIFINTLDVYLLRNLCWYISREQKIFHLVILYITSTQCYFDFAYAI